MSDAKPDQVIVQEGQEWDRSVMKLNCQQYVIRRNIRNNIRRHLPQFAVYNENPDHIALVGGGWSLNDPKTYAELREFYFRGGKIVALNGAANWLMERNLRPSMHIILDAKPENVAFIGEEIPGCRYMLASQCDGAVFDACEGRDVTIFHVVATDSEIERKRLDAYYNKRWQEVPVAGTIGIVAIPLCRMLGFRFQHMFGIDSCYPPDGTYHHAYNQPWNDAEGSADFRCGDRVFRASAWQASQAATFVDLVQSLGQAVEIEVHGDGLIAHMVRTGAELDIPAEAAA